MSDTTTEAKHEVIHVNLRDSGNANSFDKDHSFNTKTTEAAAQEIIKLVKRAATIPKVPHLNGYRECFHAHDNTVSILGGRGVGKTSFLLSLLEYLPEEMRKDNTQPKAQILSILDPNLVEGREIFLATIVAKINLEIVKHGQKHQQLPDTIGKKLMALGRAFRVLAPSVEWGKWLGDISDHDMFAREVLFDANSGIRLALSMHEYIEAVCDYLNVHALVLPLDDVDADLSSGWDLLETVRRYLASPRLITIISGDITLYRLLVRNHQWAKLDHVILQELKMQEDFSPQMKQLEEQYLKKLMPAEKRFYLFPINERIWKGLLRIKVCWEEQREKGSYRDLEEVFRAFSREALLSPVSQENCLKPCYSGGALLLPSVSRNLIRLLEALRPWYAKLTSKPAKPSENGVDDIMGVAFVFAHILSEFKIPPDDLVRLAMGRHMSWLGETMLRLREYSSNLWRLEASNNVDEKGEKLNQLALIFQMFVHRAWRRPGVPIEYCIKVVTPCMLATRYSLSQEKLNDYPRRLHLHQPEYVNDTASRILAFKLTEENVNKKMLSGIMQVPGTINKEKTFEILKSALETRKNGYTTGLDPFLYPFLGLEGKCEPAKVKEVLSAQDENGLAKIAETALASLGESSGVKPFFKKASENTNILLILFLQKQPLNKSGAIGYFVNFIGGLAVLTDLLKLSSDKPPTPAEMQRLFMLLQFRSADRTTFLETTDGVLDSEDEIEIDAMDGDRVLAVPDLLCEALGYWHSILMETRNEDGGVLPVSVIANAWGRFDNNLLTLAENKHLPTRYRTVGMMLEIWSVAWLNALLQEEVRFRVESGEKMTAVTSKSIFSTNILTNCSRFFTAIKGISDMTSIPYAVAWLHCPILLACLSKESFECAKKIIEKRDSTTSKNLLKKVVEYRQGLYWEDNPSVVDIGHEMLCSLTIADFKLRKPKQDRSGDLPPEDNPPTNRGESNFPQKRNYSTSSSKASKPSPKNTATPSPVSPHRKINPGKN